MRVERNENEPVAEFKVPAIRFERQITEWQGPEVEQKFKPFLDQINGVFRAYVLWAVYGEETTHSPVLGIVADPRHRENILQATSYVSQTKFPSKAGFFIDICFLTSKQDEEISKFAIPF